MSNYCAGCWYDREKRHGERACPFNSLYWDFHARHRDKLAKNPRIGHAFRILDNMPAEEQQKTLAQAREYLSKIEEL